jgi:hypothetical protein
VPECLVKWNSGASGVNFVDVDRLTALLLHKCVRYNFFLYFKCSDKMGRSCICTSCASRYIMMQKYEVKFE